MTLADPWVPRKAASRAVPWAVVKALHLVEQMVAP